MDNKKAQAWCERCGNEYATLEIERRGTYPELVCGTCDRVSRAIDQARERAAKEGTPIIVVYTYANDTYHALRASELPPVGSTSVFYTAVVDPNGNVINVA